MELMFIPLLSLPMLTNKTPKPQKFYDMGSKKKRENALFFMGAFSLFQLMSLVGF